MKKILIANRGEIAIRIAKTCKEMGYQTIGLYTESEKDYPHPEVMDELIFLSGNSLQETYLNAEKIIQEAKKRDVSAIHPGYGFLSENASFARLCEKNKIVFIGPTPESIEQMGDKKQSKIFVEKIKAPTIPGYSGDQQDLGILLSKAKEIGFPVLIKASFGGGGKGMKIVHQEKEFDSALSSAKREASNAFGNDHVIIEKYLINPRHIEVQVFGDGQGNVIHLFERDCSIQRRYQKIIEETPGVHLSEELRQNICNSAVNIAKQMNYRGAGTVEFILDSKGHFYFLEMNTRLQVEHPITEMLVGVDLVRWQIQLALEKMKLPTQDTIVSGSHVIECRIYAEDPFNQFLPCTGTLQKMSSSSVINFRRDSALKTGLKISSEFDPMLEKLIVWAESREQAIKKMILVLKDLRYPGIKTNRLFLIRVLEHQAFQKGQISTSFIPDHFDDLMVGPDSIAQASAIAIWELMSRKGHRSREETSKKKSVWDLEPGFKNC